MFFSKIDKQKERCIIDLTLSEMIEKYGGKYYMNLEFRQNGDVSVWISTKTCEEKEGRKIGKWVLCKDGYEDSWVCSECGEEYVLTDGTIEEQHYCSNCGARMWVDMEDEDDEDD